MLFWKSLSSADSSKDVNFTMSSASFAPAKGEDVLEDNLGHRGQRISCKWVYFKVTLEVF